MKVFIDTSSLFKRYHQENGSDELDRIMLGVSQVFISPTTWLEVQSIVSRLKERKIVTHQELEQIIKEMKKDFNFYHKIVWNGSLEREAIKLMNNSKLKTLDSIQLAAGVISKADVFITSDKILFQFAQKVMMAEYI